MSEVVSFGLLEKKEKDYGSVMAVLFVVVGLMLLIGVFFISFDARGSYDAEVEELLRDGELRCLVEEEFLDFNGDTNFVEVGAGKFDLNALNTSVLRIIPAEEGSSVGRICLQDRKTLFEKCFDYGFRCSEYFLTLKKQGVVK